MHHLNAVVLYVLLLLPLCSFAQDATVYELAGIEVQGCERTVAPIVRQMSGLRVGDKI